MSKLSKLFKHPKQFVVDAYYNKKRNYIGNNVKAANDTKGNSTNRLKSKNYPRYSGCDVSNISKQKNRCFIFIKGDNPYLDMIHLSKSCVALLDNINGKTYELEIEPIILESQELSTILSVQKQLACHLVNEIDKIEGVLVAEPRSVSSMMLERICALLSIPLYRLPELELRTNGSGKKTCNLSIVADVYKNRIKSTLLTQHLLDFQKIEESCRSILQIKEARLDVFLKINRSTAGKRSARNDDRQKLLLLLDDIASTLSDKDTSLLCDLDNNCILENGVESRFYNKDVYLNCLPEKVASLIQLSSMASIYVDLRCLNGEFEIHIGKYECSEGLIQWQQLDVGENVRSTQGIVDSLKNILNNQERRTSFSVANGDQDNRVIEFAKERSEKLKIAIEPQKTQPLDKFINDNSFRAVAYKPFQTESVGKYLASLINTDTVLDIRNLSDIDLSYAEVILKWGVLNRKSKAESSVLLKTRRLSIPTLCVEDGFIRSLDIGLSGEPTHSLIIDDIAPYYDARVETRLQKYLENRPKLKNDQIDRCQRLIQKIVNAKISKYNHAPISQLQIGATGKPKILLIDQRFGDKSVEYGFASERTFENMLFVATTKFPNHEIVIKLHPDATRAGKASYFNQTLLDKFSSYREILKIGFEINPYSLFESVEKVFVCTSGVGFEALMAGKEVYCFGVPFYSNRGLTIDYQEVGHRRHQVSLETIFYYAYIYLSRYVDPATGERCQLEDVVESFEAKA